MQKQKQILNQKLSLGPLQIQFLNLLQIPIVDLDKRIEKEIGIDNIQNVAWDTDQGRQAIGVDPKVNTSSDAFIQKKDGTVVGISLKKTGIVFINSGGWETQSNIIINNLKILKIGLTNILIT